MPKKDREPSLYSYIGTYDFGFAPNIYGFSLEHVSLPWLTLAACKPTIRAGAKPGDWVVCLTPKHYWEGDRIKMIFAMRISQAMSFKEYWKEPSFMDKRPDFSTDDRRKWVGDNFYEPVGNEKYFQYLSVHSNSDGTENLFKKARDLRGRKVLVSKPDSFFYYGKNSPLLPLSLGILAVGRNCRRLGREEVSMFERSAQKYLQTPGVHGEPYSFDRWTETVAHFRNLV